jgi:hypothetical protein
MTTRQTIIDLPLSRLRRILRDTERLLGPTAASVIVLRRAVEAKREIVRHQKGGPSR